jgi:hypothetical protein
VWLFDNHSIAAQPIFVKVAKTQSHQHNLEPSQSSLVLTPIIVYAIALTQSAKTLDATQGWLKRHNRMIVIAISLIFGLLFLFKGIIGLIG